MSSFFSVVMIRGYNDAGKNITNEVYKASRLHRLSSGIMPGGFRQINAGIKINL